MIWRKNIGAFWQQSDVFTCVKMDKLSLGRLTVWASSHYDAFNAPVKLPLISVAVNFAQWFPTVACVCRLSPVP